jgi:glycosyltransferase involved in cell wall biosynthesis
MADEPPLGLDGLPVDFTPWSLAAEVPFLQSLDVGLMPLSDDPFSRGKCGFKLLQYMACGVPSVASPVGVNCDILADGAGLLADLPAAWTDALLRLLDDAALRKDMGAVARSQATERWSSDVLGPRFATVLRDVVRSGDTP